METEVFFWEANLINQNIDTGETWHAEYWQAYQRTGWEADNTITTTNNKQMKKIWVGGNIDPVGTMQTTEIWP